MLDDLNEQVLAFLARLATAPRVRSMSEMKKHRGMAGSLSPGLSAALLAGMSAVQPAAIRTSCAADRMPMDAFDRLDENRSSMSRRCDPHRFAPGDVTLPVKESGLDQNLGQGW